MSDDLCNGEHARTLVKGERATFETMSLLARWGLALFSIAVGVYALLLTMGLVEPERGQLVAPRWVVGITGAVFVVLGIYLPLRQSKERSAPRGRD